MLETEFLIAICRFLNRARRLLRAFSIAAYPVCTFNGHWLLFFIRFFSIFIFGGGGGSDFIMS